MIDQDMMRFMATRLRAMDLTTCAEAADAIDALLAEVEAANMQLTVPDWAEGDDQAWDKVTPAVAWHLIERHGENWAHIGRLMQAYLDAHTATLRVELEAAAADKRDAERYRWLRELDSEFWEVNRMSNMARFYGETLDAEIDAALAQRQGEGS
ncbi:TPA: hypothetical protein SAO52_000174 [Burkholderia vietnamiensis]|nr:hypothetical protein [Burkholderia vietnamiensis]